MFRLLLRRSLGRHRRGIGRDIDDLNIELELGVGRDSGLIGIAISEVRRDPDAIAAALLHHRQRFRESGNGLARRDRLRAAVGRAAVEHGAVEKPAFIVDQDRVIAGDDRSAAGFDGAEDQAAGGGLAAHRGGAKPGKADSDSDEEQYRQPEFGCGGTVTGRMGEAAYGHSVRLAPQLQRRKA